MSASGLVVCVGVYEIVDRGGRKTSFAYKLEIPQQLGEVQQELQIKKEASYTLSMKVLWCISYCSTFCANLCLHVLPSCACMAPFQEL